MATKQKEAQKVSDKVTKYAQHMERLKQQRNDYKKAWENTETKFLQIKKEWKDEQYSFQQRIDEL